MEKKDIFKFIGLFVILFIVIYSYINRGVGEIYKADSLHSFLIQFKTFKGISLFLFLYNIRPFFVILPASPLALAAGAIWGKLFGLMLVILGALSSGTIGFFFGRFFGKQFFDKIAHGRISKIKSKIEQGGLVSVVFFNFAGFPWDLVSVASGISKISYKDFLMGILISAPFQSFIAVYLGDFLMGIRSAKDIFSYQILIVIGLLILGFNLAIIIRRYFKKKSL